MACQIRVTKSIHQSSGFIKQAAIILLIIFSVLLLLFFVVFYEGLMMWISAMGERQRAWDKRCSENASRLELVDSMVNQGDWMFAIGLVETPKEKRVRLLASERYLNQLINDESGAKQRLEELSEYRYCSKANTKINIESIGNEIDFLVAVYDGSVLHDCTDLYLWQQIADDLIKEQYWASVTSQPYKDGHEPILELKVNQKFTYNPRTGDRVDWTMQGKYQALITRIGACTGHRSDFLYQEGDSSFRIGKGNVDNDLEWVRANPTPDW
jgi:hypothetical protein